MFIATTIHPHKELRKQTKGTGLEAHHIVEVRFIEGLNKKHKICLDKSQVPSVALTKEEHRKFTNQWRKAFEYGTRDYNEVKVEEIWDTAQRIYANYPELLDWTYRILYP